MRDHMISSSAISASIACQAHGRNLTGNHKCVEAIGATRGVRLVQHGFVHAFVTVRGQNAHAPTIRAIKESFASARTLIQRLLHLHRSHVEAKGREGCALGLCSENA